MIKIIIWDKRNWGKFEHVLTPTIFPDGTSQVWKLPEEILQAKQIQFIWNFEAEREIIDLYSLVGLICEKDDKKSISLHIPYLPYARQDKQINNNSTFNLYVLSDLLNSLNFTEVTAVDVHNVEKTKKLINNFKNISVEYIHKNLIEKYKPNLIICPDYGAYLRYSELENFYKLTFVNKTREQLTGNITGFDFRNISNLNKNSKILLVDDICDGGGTFIGVASGLRKLQPDLHIALFVTHGIFSKGNKLEGIDEIYTTNSLSKNATAHYQV